MSDALSIFAAARTDGHAIGLFAGGQQYTFAQLADLTARRLRELGGELRHRLPYRLHAVNALETVITLYALLELRHPALLLHPQLTPPERAEVLAAATRAGGVSHQDAAAIIYTSGTTGESRGAVLTRSAFLASAAAGVANIGSEGDDCWLLCMPIARVGGLSILTRCLAARRCVALVPAFDAVQFPDWIARQRVTLVSLVPTMLNRILDAHPDWRPPPHLRVILLGGAAASPKLLGRAKDRHLPIVLTYGLTETCSQVAATPYGARLDPAACANGIPLPGVDLRIDDGRIEVRGPMLMAGYWNEAPRADDAWFDTGDLGEVDTHGYLHVHARRVDLIITGGQNAYPAEVEKTLEAHPGIAAAGVFGLPDEHWGQTVAAALVAEGEPPLDADLFEYTRQRLAPHKRPRQICYLPRLPHAPSGKLDRRALPELARCLRPLAPARDG